MPSMGSHGMLVIGDDSIYLSHLPMFMAPHDFQVVLEVTFDEAATQAYRASDPHAGQIYTFLSKRMALEDLSSDAAQPRTSFKGTLFLGHFERGGTILRKGVFATITAVAHFRRFDPQAAELSDLRYFTFGRGAQRYLAHLVTRAPDFDQVLTVAISGTDGGDVDVTAGESLIVAGRQNTVDGRIQAATTVAASLGEADGGTDVSVVAQDEVYLETGDLSSVTKPVPISGEAV